MRQGAPAARESPGLPTELMSLPSYLWRFAHLAALWGYGVSQPVFSMLKANPEFLVIDGDSRKDAVALAVVLAFAPPALAIGGELVIGFLSAKVSSLVHLAFIWFFGFLALLQLLQLFDPKSGISVVLPAAVAYAGAVAYARVAPIRSFLSISLVLPVVALALFVFTAPLAVGDAKSADVAVATKTPVVLVVFDEFTLSSLMSADGSIDAARYPGFARLARGATWYSRASTVKDRTTSAVPAILSGDIPGPDDLPSLADYPGNLFTLLGNRYAFDVHETVTRLCPVSKCPEHRSTEPFVRRVLRLGNWAIGQYLDGALPASLRGSATSLREGWGAVVEDTGVDGGAFIDSIDASDPPRTLYFVHLIEPHVPWQFLPSGRRYGDASRIAGISDDWDPEKYELWADEPWLVAQGLQRHLLQVGYVDRIVGELLDRLKAEGIYDRALVVVTADHGVSFRPGGWRRIVTRANLADIAEVPLFVKYPGQKHGREDRRAASTIDILPTIADVVGARLPWRVDGRSLLAPAANRPVTVFSRSGDPVTAGADVVSAELLRTARRNADLFGNGWNSLYRMGPRSDILGLPVASVPRSNASDSHVELLGQGELEHVRKDSGYVPVHIVGRIDWGTQPSSATIAVAMNGRIATTTTPFVSSGRTSFSAMIDERLLHDGRNTFGIYAVNGTGKATRLILLGGNGTPTATLHAASAAG